MAESMKKTRFLITMAVLTASLAGLAQDAAPSRYQRLYGEFVSHPNRLVGSDAVNQCFSVLSNELAAAGLDPKVQTYGSLVQTTERCSVAYDGKAVEPVYMVDNGVAPWALPGPISGKAVFIGGGVLEDLEGLELRGNIGVLDARRTDVSLREPFMHGMKALVLVGDETLDQWHAVGLLARSSALVPCLYMDASVAEAAGLLAADGTREISLDARSGLRDTVGQNLWVVLPGKAGWTGNLDTEEVVIFSAALDTYGFTPDRTPDNRRAANAALLADVLCGMAGKEHNRTIVGVFFGSSYAAVEGARQFYYPIFMSDTSTYTDGMDVRQERLLAEKADIENLREIAGSDTVIDSSNVDCRTVAQSFKKLLTSMAARLREPMGVIHTEIAELTSEKERGAAGARVAEIDARLAELQKELDAYKVRKAAINELQNQVARRRLDLSNANSLAVFREAQERIVSRYTLRLEELESTIRHQTTGMEICEVFKNRSLVAHFDFDFASADKPWLLSVINAYGLFRSGSIDTGAYQPALSAIGKIYDEATAGKTFAAPIFHPALTPFYKPFSLCVPVQRVVPTAITTCLGITGFQMMTVGDDLAADAMPYERPCDLSGLAPQMLLLCDALGDDLRLSMRRIYTAERMETRLAYLRSKNSRDITGVTFKNFVPESADTEGDAENAVAVFSGISHADPVVGASQEPWARIEANNSLFMPSVNRTISAQQGWRSRVWAFGFDTNGAIDRVALEKNASGIQNAPIGLFYAYGGLAFNYGYAADPLGGEMYHAKTMIARQDAEFTHYSSPRLGLGFPTAYANRSERYKRIGPNGELILGASAENTMGEGLPLDAESLLSMNGIHQGAWDLYHLNDGRLKVLRKRNIVSDDLEKLHADAKEHLDAAEAAIAGKHWLEARAHEIFASNISNRVYAPLRGVTEDLVQAVVVLLLLNIPFAFAMERLVFGFPNIYKQVLGFVGFFIATFGILFVTHPAFSLASAPIVIFLAFVIILLSVITVSIVMGKIKQEIRAMQGLSSTVHGVESDSSTSMAAILIGISGMRNRPLKTFLTSATVILLTFTILVFASFTSRQDVVTTYLGKGEGPDRIELHRFSFLDIDKNLINSVETLFGDEFRVFRRGGVFRNPTRGTENGATPLSPERVFYLPRTGKTVEAGCIMGLDPAEFECNEDLGKIAPGLAGDDPAGRDAAPIYLPGIAVDALGAEEGDILFLNGSRFRYVGKTDGAALQNMSTVDDFKIMPPDFSATVKNTGRSATDGMSAAQFEDMDTGSFEWFSSDKVAVARIADLERLFPHANDANMLFLYPRSEGVDIEARGRELAPIFHGAVHVKSSEGARRLFFTKAVAGSGFRDVVVPLLLGGLIIFSSLMGSIVDREKEIFTYSALGLAPPDVGALFFAESAVYSVIGGMGGYLLSQLVAKLLKWLGNLGLITPPEMNFSSLTSVCTILIVMAVVMLSTIYPAIKAGKSANPGVARKWKMPAPKGNRMDFVFPFTVSELDFTGILSFIREHFNNHSDATLGAFAARNVKLFRLPGAKHGRDAYGIEADISLAPFDLGIFQKFRMYSSEFEIKGIDEVVVELERIGGTPASWVRSNRAFADELRQQFLLWRSLPIEAIEHYRRETLNSLKEQEAEGSPR